MHTAGIKDIKNNLSRYLARVKFGPLIENGLIAMPTQPINKKPPARIKAAGKSTSEMIAEDRRWLFTKHLTNFDAFLGQIRNTPANLHKLTLVSDSVLHPENIAFCLPCPWLDLNLELILIYNSNKVGVFREEQAACAFAADALRADVIYPVEEAKAWIFHTLLPDQSVSLHWNKVPIWIH